MQNLGELLKDKRERLGTLRAAARALKVATGTYEAWENGWRKPRGVNEFEKLETFLGVDRAHTLFWSGLISKDAAERMVGTQAKGVYVSSHRSMVPAA